MILIFILYAGLGLLIGVLSGFFGVGGGFILTPVLLLLSVDPITAITISLMYTIGTSFSGVFAHLKMKNVKWKEAALIGVSGAAATQAANPFVFFLNDHHLDETVIPLAYVLLLGYFSWSLLLRKDKKASTGRKQGMKLLILVFTGATGGFASTLLGVGGGFILVPLLISLSGFKPREAVGTSLMSVLFIVTAGFITYFAKSPIDLSAGAMLIAGGLAGAQAGAYLTSRFEQTEIRTLLGSLYVITALSTGLKLAGLEYLGIIVLIVFIGGLYVKMGLKIGKQLKEIRSK
ncbi:sulfite exporter TauE/SafE family protein [Metabacillus indicus]|uniref:sulfite exporter TauE/SafE family protein n=1 Tax=Metabacillus indicus TaxID=246786 RepID=UPI003CF5555D